MAINIKTPGFDHVTLRITDLERSKHFYSELLGFSVVLEQQGLVILQVGGSALVLRGPEAGMVAGDTFNPLRVGLDHVALACDDETELERVATALAAASIDNTGVKLDKTLNKKYLAFKDPDRIAWEFFMVT